MSYWKVAFSQLISVAAVSWQFIWLLLFSEVHHSDSAFLWSCLFLLLLLVFAEVHLSGHEFLCLFVLGMST